MITEEKHVYSVLFFRDHGRELAAPAASCCYQVEGGRVRVAKTCGGSGDHKY